MLKKLLITSTVACLLSFTLSTAFALTPREIAQKSDDVDDGETSISEMTMIMVDSRGQKRVRKLQGFRKDYGKDTKTLNFFLSPADVKNTAFLSFDYDDPNKEDDSWLYLPALRKVKRIAASNKKDSFMGTDFSFDDMKGLDVENWDYRIIKDSVILDGHECWVLGSVPRKDIAKEVVDDTGYLKRLGWVRKDNFMTIQGKIWVKKGRKIKIYHSTDIQQIQGIWTAKKIEMSTLARGKREHSTVLLFDKIQYNEGVKDSLFTTQRIARGL